MVKRNPVWERRGYGGRDYDKAIQQQNQFLAETK
jgi:hypothetical protein